MQCMPAPQSVLGLGVRPRCARASQKLPHYIIEPAHLLIWSIFQMYYIIRVLLTKTTQNRAYQTIWVMCNARLRPFWWPMQPTSLRWSTQSISTSRHYSTGPDKSEQQRLWLILIISTNTPATPAYKQSLPIWSTNFLHDEEDGRYYQWLWWVYAPALEILIKEFIKLLPFYWGNGVDLSAKCLGVWYKFNSVVPLLLVR